MEEERRSCNITRVKKNRKKQDTSNLYDGRIVYSTDDDVPPFPRKKRKQETSNLKLSDLVYVTDNNAPPLQWPTAIVHYMYSGPDKF